MQLVDENYDIWRFDGLNDYGLHPLLKLAAIFRSGYNRGNVELQNPFFLQDFGNILFRYSLSEAFDNGGFTDAGLPNKHRIVLTASRKDMYHPLDLVFPANDRVKSAFSGKLSEVN